jgi:hypothetical protein
LFFSLESTLFQYVKIDLCHQFLAAEKGTPGIFVHGEVLIKTVDLVPGVGGDILTFKKVRKVLLYAVDDTVGIFPLLGGFFGAVALLIIMHQA